VQLVHSKQKCCTQLEAVSKQHKGIIIPQEFNKLEKNGLEVECPGDMNEASMSFGDCGNEITVTCLTPVAVLRIRDRSAVRSGTGIDLLSLFGSTFPLVRH